MAVLDFNAYYLEYFIEGTGSYDENGDYQENAGYWESLGKCNAVPSSGTNNVIPLPDGKEVRFSFTIHIHNPLCREFTFGERLRLTTVNGCEQKDLTVKGFSRYQHQCKIYA